MDEEKGIREYLEEINRKLDDKGKKDKGFKLPSRARVSNGKLKKGYITVEVINENKEVSFVKEPIVEGTIKLGTTYHAIDDLDIFTHKGKPFIHQPKTKINPWNPLSQYLNTKRTYNGETLNKNEIYGQDYVMARMKSDIIKPKKTLGWAVWVFVIVVGGIVAYAFLKG